MFCGDESGGGGGRALVAETGLRPLVDVLFLFFGIVSCRAVVADVGVDESFGVAERGVPSPDRSRGTGFHSGLSTRCTGRCLDKIDWTGGAYRAGIGG